jgi:hypothetical protein
MRVLLLHSPLVGPSTVRPLAARLEDVGWSPIVPDVRRHVDSPGAYAGHVLRSCKHADVVVGHSGAGAFLPVIGERLGAAATVFVDAVLPLGDVAAHRPSDDLRRLLDRLPDCDGYLPRWSDWWSPDVIERLVPHPDQRRQLVGEMVAVPRSFFDAEVELPVGWHRRPAAYVQSSAAYDDDANRAERWGWPTVRLDGGHLDLAVDPLRIAPHVVDLVGVLLTGPG